jgi:hypothetical protein
MRASILALVTATFGTVAAQAQPLTVQVNPAPPAYTYTYATPLIWTPFSPSPIFVPSLVVFRYGQHYPRRITTGRRTYITYDGPYFRP